MATKKVAKKKAAAKAAKPRPNYGSFFEAWPQVQELRKWTTQQGQPRIGLEGEDLQKAQALIAEYKNG